MSVFDDGQTTDRGQETNQDEWLKKVVEEKGEQWKDPETLAKGYANAQELINQLKQQTEELREDLNKRVTMEDLLEQLQNRQANPPAGGGSEDNGGTDMSAQNTDVSEENIKSLIEQTITQRETANTSAQNVKVVEDKLNEMFGTEAGKTVKERLEGINMPLAEAQQIAERSPTAFFKLIGEEVKQQANPRAGGTVNVSAGSNQSGVKNSSYYQDLRRKDKKLYHSPKIQNEMMKQRMLLGDEFYK